MAELRIGKFLINPQSGPAGEHQIVHKIDQNNLHTGRSVYEKVVKAYITSSKYAIENLLITGAPVSVKSNTNHEELGYNETIFTIPIVTNASGIEVTYENVPTAENIRLIKNDGYSIIGSSNNIAEFPSGFGTQNEGSVNLKFSVNTNTSSSDYTYKIHLEPLSDVGDPGTVVTIDIIHQNADTAGEIQLETTSITHMGSGETTTISLSNVNVPYVVQPNASWITTDKTAGNTTDTTIAVSTDAQVVGANARSGKVLFKSQYTGKILATLDVYQEAGEAYSISWSKSSLEFKYNETTTKTNVLTSNAEWQLEEDTTGIH